MMYQIVNKKTGTEKSGVVMTPEGRILDISDAIKELKFNVLNPEDYVVRITRTFRHSGLESRVVEDIAEYVNERIENAFGGKLSPDMTTIITEILLNTFHDGMIYCEELHVGRKRDNPVISLQSKKILNTAGRRGRA